MIRVIVCSGTRGCVCVSSGALRSLSLSRTFSTPSSRLFMHTLALLHNRNRFSFVFFLLLFVAGFFLSPPSVFRPTQVFNFTPALHVSIFFSSLAWLSPALNAQVVFFVFLGKTLFCNTFLILLP